MAGVIRAVSGTDILGSSVNSLMHGDLASAGGLFRMGSKVVLGEVFGQWNWQRLSPTDAAAAGFSTRVIGKGGMGGGAWHCINRPGLPRACALLRAGSSAPLRPRCGA